MRCKELRRILNQGYTPSHPSHIQVLSHTRQCEDCREALVMDRLALALLKATHTAEVDRFENPYLMTRIRARIRELSEHSVGSWESAVLALRGWLLAFGAVAILLLTISLQWQLSNTGNPNDPDNEAITLSNINDEFISGQTTAPPKIPEVLEDEAVGPADKNADKNADK